MSKISIKNLAQAIYESSQGKEGVDLDDVIKSSVTFIRDKNLLSKSKDILEALEGIIDKENGVVKARVSAGHKLGNELEKEIEGIIKRKYKADKVIIEEKENPKLLGGIKIEVGDEVIDTTLSNKINQLQNYLIKN